MLEPTRIEEQVLFWINRGYFSNLAVVFGIELSHYPVNEPHSPDIILIWPDSDARARGVWTQREAGTGRYRTLQELPR